ncbi:1,6-anhydro-N-acetylmuramyl-L-alanine amidase AmpD [Raoultella ornithinolytica]|jgi:AmpD protein|uniref:1,6-anhydro-N-acetylmuramyl-L-alanine amidase AmpD n=1 Tax=Raoultella ornithinolytica TaxID=54291 RepID=A0ABZ2DSV1_RAOOR|nr:1,6-anhydro-N-acetylmuramyl-L-alanine amidase AmpD [Raoultella ornithinolytica]EHT13340.1 1,6-anhydro-N-acetylmuramyl-L-alanine amidase AmpD [Raoultella ornithinolytica 10-5246]EKU2863992.1 1,6-anhydro-N-acetylmuramyl-L-alanine amidase AmpD [Raoultella ornithinolytica]ELS0895206.1 1,6-anhydro-N-acetylmuramyl-L-alanine amidase AmpD [Raoultella ornithinolytica]ELS1886016.1 1,6-anhydro-N-acetylmuramyl-L-alanine amidase AmpD [Raoultella ornithinolytica]ELS5401841.1 1,6-anhydro-N-acetylmuramyl-L
MQLNGGWLVDARRVPSPHHDCRPDDEAPSLLVVHNISLPPGEFGGPWIDALFTGTLDPSAHPFFAEIAHLRVSAHCLIRRDGEIVQYVPFDKRAWHAGVSSYHGRERCNDFSIGIELEGTDTLAYTDAQYQQLVTVTRQLIALYPAIARHMTGHSDIAPVRKTDPGPAFDWAKFRGLLAASSEKEMP